MRPEEFVALLTANASKSRNVRVYTGQWGSGVSLIPDSVSTKIGKIVALLQASVDQERLCTADEGLFIYNLQPVSFVDQLPFYELEILIKPLQLLNAANDLLNGRQLSLCINSATGQLMNATQGLLDLGFTTQTDIENNKMEPPCTYGKYDDYRAYCCFIAISSFKPIHDLQVLFSGEMDAGDTMQRSVAFNSESEARIYLSQQLDLGRYIGEINSSCEDFPLIKAQGVSKALRQVTNYATQQVVTASIEKDHPRDEKTKEGERLAHKPDTSSLSCA